MNNNTLEAIVAAASIAVLSKISEKHDSFSSYSEELRPLFEKVLGCNNSLMLKRAITEFWAYLNDNSVVKENYKQLFDAVNNDWGSVQRYTIIAMVWFIPSKYLNPSQEKK